jgi:hypothetical protein
VIEGLAVGDRVLGKRQDVDAEARPYRITGVYQSQARTLVYIDLGGGTLRATRPHPFSVPGRGWIPAARLRAGDRLEGLNGEAVEIRSVTVEWLREPVTTYNLSVEEANTYFVVGGGQAVLVHNNGQAKYDQVLYWFFGKNLGKARVDADGVSIWRTTSADEVRILMETRVQQMTRPVTDPHTYWTEAEFQAMLAKHGLSAPQTNGTGPVADALGTDHHHSVRTSDADPVLDPSSPPAMSDAQREAVTKEFSNMETPTITNPKKVQTDFGGCG